MGVRVPQKPTEPKPAPPPPAPPIRTAQLTVDVEIGPTMRAALDVLDFYIDVRDELPSDCELLERFDDRAAALMDVVNAFMRRA